MSTNRFKYKPSNITTWQSTEFWKRELEKLRSFGLDDVQIELVFERYLKILLEERRKIRFCGCQKRKFYDETLEVSMVFVLVKMKGKEW